jgi:hypothetical protein
MSRTILSLHAIAGKREMLAGRVVRFQEILVPTGLALCWKGD